MNQADMTLTLAEDPVVSLKPELKTLAGYRIEGAACSSYKDTPILPTLDELEEEVPYLRPNVTNGAYPNVTEYLDIQFRLLREDFVAPLRSGVQEYRRLSADSKESRIPRTRLRSIENVHFFTDVLFDKEATRQCVLHPEQRVFRLAYRDWGSVDWEHSTRLMEGSLIAVSYDDFASIFFATVARRVPKQLGRGFLTLQFFDEEACRALNPTRTFTLMESSSAYFEAYRHNLRVLQSVDETTLPLTPYLVYAKKVVRTPAFLKRHANNFDFSPVLRSKTPESTEGGSPEVRRYTIDTKPKLRCTPWPSQEDTVLNVRQYAALRSALSHELCLVQGPPGTGKTFVALKMVEMALLNELTSRPILVVCYTNHALDQFLEGILRFTHKIVRIGGSCKSATLKPFTLSELRQGSTEASQYTAQIKESKKILAALRKTETLLAKLMGKTILDDSELTLSPSLTLSQFLKVQELVKSFRRLNRLKPSGGAVRDLKYLSDLDCGEVEADENLESKDILQAECDSEQEKIIHMLLGDASSGTLSTEEVTQLRHEVEQNNGRVMEDSKRWKIYKHYHWLIAEYLANEYLEKCLSGCAPQELEFASARKAQEALSESSGVEVQAAISCLRERAKHLRHLHRRQVLRIEQEQCSSTYNLIARDRSIVGMTTTGAAKYNALVRRLQPEIVVVEEAAEILEGHLLGSLISSVKQLILIGDHQQLQPSTTVHTLATKFGMQVSMFERLVRNGLQFVQLQEQHRMRDPFRQLLVPTIYNDYVSHSSVFNYPDARGVSSNMFFVRHSHEELSDRESHSKSNKFEAKFVTRLALHFRQQGYVAEDVTILATYRGQVAAIEAEVRELNCANGFSAMRDEKSVESVKGRLVSVIKRVKENPDLEVTPFEGVRITTVDNYQGEESRIIILSLVRSNANSKIGFLARDNRICVALSRAKVGLFAVGNLALLARVSPTWGKICSDLEKKHCIGEGIELKCEMHSKRVTVTEPEGFNAFPKGGCGQICNASLPCGHKCQALCHGADPVHEAEFSCSRPCQKRLECRHICVRTCAEDCTPCIVPRLETLACGHTATVKCSTPTSEVICQKLCERTLRCGHACDLRCGEPCSCRRQVTIKALCGHKMAVQCKDRDRVLKKCMVSVFRKLECGHKHKMPCSRNVSTVNCTQIRLLRCHKGHTYEMICHKASSHIGCPSAFVIQMKCGHASKFRCSDIEWCAEMDKCKQCNQGIACKWAISGLKCPKLVREKLACNHLISRQCGDVFTASACTQMTTVTWNGKHTTVPCFMSSRQIDTESSNPVSELTHLMDSLWIL